MRQGLDLDDWAAAEPAEGNSRLSIGYIGQIARHKGVDVLVEAFQRLRARGEAPRLMLYGDPERFPRFTKQLRAMVANREDVVFAGQFKNSRIREIHAGIDVLVVPSIWYENSPNVILEAFATGTPIVVSRLGGMAELVSDGENGFQFEAGSSEDLARVLQRFIDRPDLVEVLGQGMPPVKTLQVEVKELLAIYTTLEVGEDQQSRRVRR
jgi:glycosyltransferase involved in cell wall biosynthesis